MDEDSTPDCTNPDCEVCETTRMFKAILPRLTALERSWINTLYLKLEVAETDAAFEQMKRVEAEARVKELEEQLENRTGQLREMDALCQKSNRIVGEQLLRIAALEAVAEAARRFRNLDSPSPPGSDAWTDAAEELINTLDALNAAKGGTHGDD